MENQNQIEHFQWGHFGAILLCAVFLMGITFMRNGFHFAPLQTEKPTLTYEQALQQAQQNNPELAAVASGGQSTSTDNNSTNDQIAMIDPTARGNVLGASTDSTAALENPFTPEKLNALKINPLGYTNAQVVQKYSDQLSLIESTYDSLGLLGNFSSGDVNGLKTNERVIPSLIGELTNTKVPSDVVYYHKYKIIYYTLLLNMSQMKDGVMADDQFPALTQMLFSVTDTLNNLRTQVQSKYNITLP